MADKGNKVIGATVEITQDANELYRAKVTFNWQRGAKTELLTPTAFDSIPEALAEAGIAVIDILPNLEAKLADLGVDIQDPKHGDAVGMVPMTDGKSGPTQKVEVKDMTHVEFMGEVAQLACECHKGQWAVGVFVLDKKTGKRRHLDTVHVENEKAANDKMESIVMTVARRHLDTMGLKVEEAAKITVKRGDDATRAEANARAMIDKTLH